jgi:hypothetical protein
MKYWSVVTSGDPRIKLKNFYRSESAAICAAKKSRARGCTTVRVMAHSTRSLAETSDISQIREGEHVIAVF